MSGTERPLPRPVLQVVAGLIEDDQGRILLAQRPPGRHHAGLWEFPGGKIEAGEDAFAALKRELREELDIQVEAACRLLTVVEARDRTDLHLQAWRILRYSGQPRPIEASALDWHRPAELLSVAMPPADLPIARCQQMPAHYVISPDLAGFDREKVGNWLKSALDAGYRWLRLRGTDPTLRLPTALLQEWVHRAAQVGATLFVDLADHLAHPHFPCGVHLRAADLSPRVAPVIMGGPVLASCHDHAELAQAEYLGVDAVLISPVLATRSHPGQPALGWSGFQALHQATRLPAYALGGLGRGHLETARQMGAVGIAGISGLLP